MKKVIFISSGQDSLYCLHKALSETDDDVHAINISQQYNFSKVEIEYTRNYMNNSVEWLQQNVRDFKFTIVPEIDLNWGSQIPWRKRTYEGLSEESVKIVRASNIKYKADRFAMQIVERDFNFGHYGKFYNADEIIIGVDYYQSQNQARIDGTASIAQIEFGMDFNMPIAESKLGRISVYEALPEGLRDVMIPCSTAWRDDASRAWRAGPGEKCNNCRKCLTSAAYEKVNLTDSLTVKELDDILHNHVINHENYQQLSAMIIVQQKLRAYLGITLAPINIGD